MEPSIIFEGERWRVVNKPAGWLTVPGRGEGSPVLSAWLDSRYGEKHWIIHRIDRETSGVVAFARNADAHREANAWFSRHEVKKSYDFLAQGKPHEPIFKISTKIEGAASTTQIEVVRRFQSAFLGRAFPRTGRRHQIRIHLSGSGFPILGDTEYGGPATLDGIAFERVALHAALLEFPGEFPGEVPDGKRFEAPWPEDFTSWVERLPGAFARSGCDEI